MPQVSDINRALLPKKVDSFYVSFFGLPENTANILGRQVKSLERPTLTFPPAAMYNKGKRQQVVGNLEFADLSIVFEDDNNSLVIQALYYQLYRQAGRLPGQPTGNDAKFEIGLKAYGAGDNAIIEEFTMKACWIANITHSENIYADSTANLITVTIAFDDVEYKFIEECP